MTLAELFGVRYAIVQAPMANVQSTSLAAAVSNAGALGTIAGAPLSPDALREAIRETRAATSEPFAVNLFAPLPRAEAPAERIAALQAVLAPHRARAGLGTAPAPRLAAWTFDEQLAVVLEERPAVFSSTFGAVDPGPLREAGIVVVGTATTVEEAVVLEASGVDAIVAQGAEAGGHRGTFLGSFGESLVPLAELVPAAAATVSVPVLAAGGIVDGAGIAAALAAGAQGVQLGTAFLFTPECATPRVWLAALREGDTFVTPAYSGRHARAARTPFLEELEAAGEPLPYPLQRAVIADLARVDGYGLYLGGTGAPRARELPVAELVRTLVAETDAA
ncbi:MAG TPA: nitronate monooxygenase [Gaiellaceae bacterium]